MNVVEGQHKGKTGKVSFYRTEGDGGRLTLLLSDGTSIYVDKDEIDFKFTCIAIEVMMDTEERTAKRARIKELEENEWLT